VNAPEVVFADDVPEGGVKEGSAVKFRFYVKGDLQSGKEVHASYLDAPIHEDPAEGPMNDDWFAKVTDSDGYATFLLDHAGTWFVSMADEDAGYTGGIMFNVVPLAEGEEAEADLTEFLIAEGANKANLGFPSYGDGDFSDEAHDKWGAENASGLTTKPLGSTAFLTGQRGQLAGEGTGVTFEIPLDRPREGVGGMTGFEQSLGLTAEILGEKMYNDMVAFLKEENENSPGKFMDFGGDYGKWYLPYTAKEFFDHFGLAVMGKFSDDHVTDIGDDFQLGILYDEEQFNGGTVSVMYGSMIMDSGPKDGRYWREITPDGYPVKVSLLYDGKSDDEINFSYWLAEKGDDGDDDGSGGCNAGLPAAIGMIALLAACFAAGARKRLKNKQNRTI
jgi:hypothetical protein